ncbi:MAG TPA: hypothetical protein VJ280_03160, partial [Dehalococcoidales bacterium]|nr:hypothetical protein [Dehalococcoidales bacterium]
KQILSVVCLNSPTIRALQKLGIEKKKIRMVFNKLDVDESVTDEFAALFGLAESEKSFIVRPEAVIYQISLLV